MLLETASGLGCGANVDVTLPARVTACTQNIEDAMRSVWGVLRGAATAPLTHVAVVLAN